MRKCRTGYKIAPLYAQNSQQAFELIQALRAQAGLEEKIFLDVPEVNNEAVNLAESLKMNRVFETARMYTGDFPVLPFSQIFGITSFEIG